MKSEQTVSKIIYPQSWRYMILFFLITNLLSNNVMAQRPHHLLTGVVVSTLSTYDFKYKSYEQGISINAMLIGLTYTLEHPGLIKGKSNAELYPKNWTTC